MITCVIGQIGIVGAEIRGILDAGYGFESVGQYLEDKKILDDIVSLDSPDNAGFKAKLTAELQDVATRLGATEAFVGTKEGLGEFTITSVVFGNTNVI